MDKKDKTIEETTEEVNDETVGETPGEEVITPKAKKEKVEAWMVKVKIVQGTILGKKPGEEVIMSEDMAIGYGKEYVEIIK